MAKMTAAQAAAWVLEKEGITQVFGVPGAAINPFYAAMKKQGSIGHILARHVEGASHMAEGYTRASGRQHRRLHRHLRPGRHRHDHRPVLGPGRFDTYTLHYRPGAARPAVQGRLPGSRYRIHCQAGHQMGRHRARTGAGAHVFQQAFHVMRSGRPGPVLIDLPFDVQMARDRIRPRDLCAAPVYKPRATRAQIEKALAMLKRRSAR